ncbi:MAG: PH domain-containing protein [Bacteroidales bacterium]|nr:PH domain-containing protein [Bacteroidales bacterium]
METTFNVRWSLPVKIITTAVSFLLLGAVYTLYKSYVDTGAFFELILMIIIFVLPLLFLLNAPLSVTLSEKSFTLKKIAGTLSIDYDQISAIQPYKFGCDIRLFGSGGLGGYIGLFSGKEIGKYYAFAGDTEQAYCIFLKSGKKYVFSCEDYESVIAFINKRIHFTPSTFTFTSDSEN